MKLLSRLLALVPLLCLLPAVRAEPVVLVSVKPLQMLVAGVTEGVTVPRALLPAQVSPHGYVLKPSQVGALQVATVVFWFGPGLESLLAPNLARLPATVRVEQVLAWPELKALPLRDDHGHGGNGQLDAHVWLDPVRAQALVRHVAAVLAETDPVHADAYRGNAERLAGQLAALDLRLKTRLAPVKARPYWVYHDGYQYFESRYGLAGRGALNQSPEQPLKPQALLRLTEDEHTRCVFLDGQYQATSVARRLAELDRQLVALDPFGVAQSADPAGYAATLETMAAAMAGCLAGH